MKRYLFWLPLMIFLLAACTEQDSNRQKKIVIGFSQCTTGDVWRKTMHEEMLRELSFYRDYDIDLIIKDAYDDNNRQIQDIKDLVASGIDILIVSPNEADPLTPVVEEVYEQGIPVIVIDRKINSEKFTAYVGANNLMTGKEAGQLAADLLKGKGKILEITGLKGSTSAIERSQGFREVIKRYPDIEIVASLEGEWLIEVSQRITDSIFSRPSDIDLVFAHNDPMAYGAYRSASKHGMAPRIIGVDGLHIPNGGLDLVVKGYIQGTVLYPTGGDKAIQLAMHILSGAPYDRFNFLKTAKIDLITARTLKLQGEQIQEQQAKIDVQRGFIGEMDYLIQKQKTFLLLLGLIILLLILLVGLIIYFLYKKNQINKILDSKNKTIEQQNKKITQQRDEVIRVLKIAEEATEMKLRFFTNISHEFRTTLSLIALPVNELVANGKKVPFQGKLQIIQKNTNRLLRLSEEILDFRKIDKQKYQLETIHQNMVPFIADIANTFTPKADKKNLHIIYKAPEKLEADFDPGIMEKVMCNLLSNALKYTQSGGEIRVELIQDDPKVIIEVQDNGIGITDDQLPFIFDLFHRIQPETHLEEPGMGIGLALCKELIQIHNGTITVKSNPQQGTSFRISIPRIQPTILHNMDSHPEIAAPAEQKIQTIQDKNKTILIVEDNPELLHVLTDIIGKYYAVLTASDGKQGFEIASQNLPDLIISDIFMPVMDGIELCREVKKHPAIFQIPVILLTAIDSQQSKMSSFDIGADDYLTKPFNEHILLSRIRNLIESREKLENVFKKQPFLLGGVPSKEKTEQEFVNRCIEIIHENVSDEAFHLDQLADLVNVSRSSLYRKIKTLTGLKGVDFIKKVRLQYAAKLLLNDDVTISEVAWQSGFSDVKYFSKCFSKEFKYSPSKFKNALLSAKDISEFI